jgi:hypothetical protein
MPTVDTALSPREVLNRLYAALRAAYLKVNAAKPGDVLADRGIISDIATIEALSQKLSYSFIKKLKDDSNIDVNSLEKLKEIERILDEIVSGKRNTIRQDHFVYRAAKHLRRVVRGQERKNKRQGYAKLRQITQDEMKLKTQKKEAFDKIGVKRAA